MRDLPPYILQKVTLPDTTVYSYSIDTYLHVKKTSIHVAIARKAHMGAKSAPTFDVATITSITMGKRI